MENNDAPSTPRDMHTDFDIDDPSLSERFEEILVDLVATCHLPLAPCHAAPSVMAMRSSTNTPMCADARWTGAHFPARTDGS